MLHDHKIVEGWKLLLKINIYSRKYGSSVIFLQGHSNTVDIKQAVIFKVSIERLVNTYHLQFHVSTIGLCQ